jgi:putative transposase
MKKKRFTEQQIIGFLKEAEVGIPVRELCRKHGFSDAAFYKWRSKFGGMDVLRADCFRAMIVDKKGRLSALLTYALL